MLFECLLIEQVLSHKTLSHKVEAIIFDSRFLYLQVMQEPHRLPGVIKSSNIKKCLKSLICTTVQYSSNWPIRLILKSGFF